MAVIAGDGDSHTCEQAAEIPTSRSVTSGKFIDPIPEHFLCILAQFLHHLHIDGISAAVSGKTD